MLKIFKHLSWKEWLAVAISTVFIVAQVYLDLEMPTYLKEVITLTQDRASAMTEILKNGGYMLLCALGSLGSAIFVGYLSARVATAFAARLRSKVFNKTLDFSMEEINSFSTSSLITRTTNDITQVQMLISMGLQAVIKAPILAVWAIIKISGKSWQWMIATAAAVAVLLLIVVVIMVFALPKFRKMQTLIDNLNRETRENLTGLRVVRSFNAADYQQNKFGLANDELTRTQLFTSRIMSIMQPGMTIIMSGLSLSIYWIGAFLINNADIAQKVSLLGDMMTFTAYAMQIIMAFMLLIIVFIMFPRAAISAKRINEVLDKPVSIKDGTFSGSTEGNEGTVEFKNVSFKYPDAQEAIIRDISFKAKKGETVAFIGSTGSGKSTLINLVPRFYDATSGQILIDGVNIQDYKLETLHNKIGYVPQKAVIFSGTIGDNITYGDNGKDKPTEQELKIAADIAQATSFIEEKEDGFGFNLSQGGTNVSGGQKQRLAIARAIARKPEIYIFDDSFSALDYKTDRLLRSALKEKTAGATSLIVGQRIGTIRDADKILVLEQGKVVGMGTHSELMKTCDVYKEIALSQLSKEELENE